MGRTLLLGMLTLGCGSSGDDASPPESIHRLGNGWEMALPHLYSDAGVADVSYDSAPADAGCVCPAPTSCAEHACIDDRCVELPFEDGLGCGEAHVCVDGACIERFGCGDGYREPGPAPTREACDDGNVDDSDLCSSECEPVARFAEPDVEIGVDGRGRVLTVWIDEGVVMMRARSRGGVSTSDAIAIGLSSEPPTLVGLFRGWAVAWVSAETDRGDVRFRIVDDDLMVGPQLHLAEVRSGRQHEPTLARTDDGFAAAWSDESQLSSGDGVSRVRARFFDRRGHALTSELAVSADGGAHSQPTIAGGRDGLVAWTDAGGGRVLARTLGGDTFELGTGFAPAVAELGDGHAVAWSTREHDGRGDVHVALIDSSGDVERFPVATDPDRPELATAMSAHGDGLVVGHTLGTTIVGRVVDADLVSVDTELAPEAASIVELLHAEGVQRSVALTRARDTLWVRWTDDDDTLLFLLAEPEVTP